MTEQDIQDKALALPAPSRAKLAHQLLESLDGADNVNFEEAWLEEVRRRDAERVASGLRMGTARDAIAEVRRSLQ